MSSVTTESYTAHTRPCPEVVPIPLTSTVMDLPLLCIRIMLSSFMNHPFAVYTPDYTEPGVLDYPLA
jgi:hypothetical protein